MKRFGFTMTALGLIVSGCSHGATSALPSVAKTPQRMQATFVMHWPAPKPKGAHPNYVSPWTQSVSIQVNSNQSIPVISNNPGKGQPTSIPIDAPVGTDAFIIKAYDQQGAQGNILSQTQISQKIVAGTANTVSATLDGVVASAVLGLSNTNPPAGVASTPTITLTARDADGNVIVGPGGYANPIALSDSDSFATQLSETVVSGPSNSVTLSYNGKSVQSATISASATGLPSGSIAPVVFHPAPTFYEFAVGLQPLGITQGPDGALWFTQFGVNEIGRITTSGTLTQFAIPAVARGIAAGPDGALWFTEVVVNKIGRVTTGGTVTEFPIPTANSLPQGIAAGPDGALWFTESNSNKIGRITTSGTFTEFGIPTSSVEPERIAAGPDGALWFTEYGVNQIGRITTGGTLSEYPIPTANSFPYGITAGPDGALWFAGNGSNKIDRITTGGAVTEFPTLTPASAPIDVAFGRDGTLWFTELVANQIGQITTSGVAAEYQIPSESSAPYGIVAGPDGALWFTENSANKIGRLAY